MTTETLKEAIKLNEKIQKLEAFCEAFHEPCMKGLIAYRIGIKEPATLSIEDNSALYKMIDGYLERKLSEYNKQFAKLI